MSAGWALGGCIARACATYGWPARIRGVMGGGTVGILRGGGTVESPPSAILPQSDSRGVTEIAISDRRKSELTTLGLLPLLGMKHSDEAVFIGSQTLHHPAKGRDQNETAQNMLSSRLPYQLTHAPFAHYLMCMTRDRIGSIRDAHQLEGMDIAITGRFWLPAGS